MANASLNALTPYNPEYWASMMQETFFKESVAIGIANLELRADLADGDTIHKPFSSYPRVQTYTKGADIVVKDIDSTDDFLTVNTAKIASFYVDDIDKKQNKYKTIKEFAGKAMNQLNTVLDQAVMGEYSNADTTISGASIGEAAGGIVMSAANTANIFIAAGRVLNKANRTGGERFAVIGPRMLEIIQQSVSGRETAFGEQVSDNGRVGRRFGFSLRLSNNLPFTATLDGATIFVDGETITIDGVVLTADADGAAAGAGAFSIQANAALCIAQLASLINDDGTPGIDEYIALSTEDRQTLETAGIVATISGTDLLLTAYGDLVVSNASAGSGWSAQTQYALMGEVGSIDLVTQKAPNVEFRKAELRLGTWVHPWMLYGIKTFTRSAGSLVAVQFDVSNWS